jgi:peptidoglycan/LPS O-acetylase OafA/YrhL
MKRLAYSLVLGMVGLMLAEKHTYWMPGTYIRDFATLMLGVIGGGIIGFLLGCIVEEGREPKGRKIVYWILAMAIFGYYLGAGRGVSFTMTLTVVGWSAGVGLALGVIQYSFESRKIKQSQPPSQATRGPEEKGPA